jgi:hypothetical protein
MKTLLLLLGILVLLPYAQFVFAEPSAPPAILNGGSERRNLSELTDISIQAQGGNITQIDIDALTITRSWQGYYGNISGGITLDDANNNTFYNWSVTAGSAAGEVYATRNDTITWTGINCTSSAQRSSEESFLSQFAGDGDSVTNTFNTTTHPSFIVGSENITADSCFSTNTNVNGAPDVNRFHQVLLTDGSAAENIVYTSLIDPAQTGYDGGTYDFQLLVGEDESDGNEGPTTYYIWVELG